MTSANPHNIPETQNPEFMWSGFLCRVEGWLAWRQESQLPYSTNDQEQ